MYFLSLSNYLVGVLLKLTIHSLFNTYILLNYRTNVEGLICVTCLVRSPKNYENAVEQRGKEP